MVWLKAFWEWITFPVKFYVELFKEKKKQRDLQKKIKELQKRDKNHIYSHFEAGKIKNVAGFDIEVDEPTKADWTIISDNTSSKALSSQLMAKLKEENFI